MKNICFVLVFLFAFSSITFSQTPYVSTVDNSKTVVLNGLISKYALQNNPAFSWYASNQNNYTPTTEILKAFEAAKNKYQFLIFGGTWCGDTQTILPKFFKIQEQSGIADKDISFFGVDHAKKTLGNMENTFKITNVPTVIVLKDGKEVGRVVEYGKTGKWDKEIADLLK